MVVDGVRRLVVIVKAVEDTEVEVALMKPWALSDPGTRDSSRGTLLLGYEMGHGPRPTSVVTTHNAVGLLVQ
jgi:hypothetical protein